MWTWLQLCSLMATALLHSFHLQQGLQATGHGTRPGLHLCHSGPSWVCLLTKFLYRICYKSFTPLSNLILDFLSSRLHTVRGIYWALWCQTPCSLTTLLPNIISTTSSLLLWHGACHQEWVHFTCTIIPYSEFDMGHVKHMFHLYIQSWLYSGFNIFQLRHMEWIYQYY